MRVTESLGPAWEQMKRLLFRPFNLGTWFAFGFVFFLQSCMEGGGNSNFRLPNTSGWGSGGGRGGGGGGGGGGHSGFPGGGSSDDYLGGFAPGPFSGFPDLDDGVLIGLGVGLLVAIVALTIVALWLGTRGQMMAIRSVAHGYAAVGEAWTATADCGTALFKFHLVLIAVGVGVFLPILAGGIVVGLPLVRGSSSIGDMWPALVALVVVALIAVLPFALVGALTRNFVAPIMLKDGVGARDAWKRFWGVAKDHVGSLFVYFLLRILFSIGAAIVGMVAGFATCCIGLLPVMHQTLMAPWYVFERAWALEVLASLGPQFDLMVRVPAAPPWGGQGGGGYGPPAHPGGYYAPPQGPMPYGGGGGGWGPPR